MEKTDYSRLAEMFDFGRPILEFNMRRWLDLIAEYVGPSNKNVELLDLGCGTGRFSIPIASKLGYKVTGADISRDMIQIAKEKPGSENVGWDIQDATSLSYPNESFDVIFMSHLLEHTEDPLKVLIECHRVLRKGSPILHRYKSIDDLRKDPEHVFFPNTTRVDESRITNREKVEEYFRIAGFKMVSSETVVQQTYKDAYERVKTDKLKTRSVLGLIDEESFNEGIKKLTNYVQNNPRDPWLLMDSMTLTTGKK